MPDQSLTHTPGHMTARHKELCLIVKISKYCNLRCTYCYEFSFLNQKARISLDNLERMFSAVAAYAAHHQLEAVEFIWHGGEPLLVPIDVYDEIAVLQRRAMQDVVVRNNVQTNLTVLTDRHIDYLRHRIFFNQVSISFDVFGTKRVDKKGNGTTNTVLRNMRRLMEADVPFSSICVLARNNVASVAEMFDFFDQINRNCRFLPFFQGTDATGDQSEALSQQEISSAMIIIFERWAKSENAILISPLAEWVDIAKRFVTYAPHAVYQKAEEEWIYAVDTDGSLWGISQIEDQRFQYGNIFENNLGSILSGAARQATLTPADARIVRVCGLCPYLGHCSGAFFADATDGILSVVERDGCHIRVVVDHIVSRSTALGIEEARRI